MTDFSQFIPEHIRKLAEGTESRPLKQGRSGTKPIALNLNENPFGPSPRALRELQILGADLHRYPEIHASALNEEVASFHDVNNNQVLVTAGATELLGMIARTLLAKELNAVTSARSFIVYKLATQVTEGKLIEVPTHDNGYDLEAISAAINANTRIVFIANPNNPTGTLLSADEVDRFVERLPPHVLLVLDEAYGDFAQYFAVQRGIRYSRALDYVREDCNVVLLKTFSKAHGLAGLRAGYGIGPARLMSLFAPARTIFSVSSLAQVMAAAALRDAEHISAAVENNWQQVEFLAGELEKLKFSIPMTWANFLFCELGRDAENFAGRLLAAGVSVQPLGSWGAPTAIRISIGTPEQNQSLLTAMQALLH
jgi:histidinol-phosphate aminotransferase